jgi:hypothetical protein
VAVVLDVDLAEWVARRTARERRSAASVVRQCVAECVERDLQQAAS